MEVVPGHGPRIVLNAKACLSGASRLSFCLLLGDVLFSDRALLQVSWGLVLHIPNMLPLLCESKWRYAVPGFGALHVSREARRLLTHSAALE